MLKKKFNLQSWYDFYQVNAPEPRQFEARDSKSVLEQSQSVFNNYIPFNTTEKSSSNCANKSNKRKNKKVHENFQ